MILSIPYKALSKCGIDELAVQQRWNDERSGRNTGGVMFARKEERSEKSEARAAILALLTMEGEPDRVSILSMPGVDWTFEAALLKQREPQWRHQTDALTMRLTCLENDRFIYYSAVTKIPRPRIASCVLKTLQRPEYAETAMGNGIIDRYVFANIDELMQHSGESFDYAWLDYTGPLSIDRMKIIQRFWRERVRRVLVVTSLKARWNRKTSDLIASKGGCMNWLRSRLDGNVIHEIEYQDGASPMVQFAIAKATGA